MIKTSSFFKICFLNFCFLGGLVSSAAFSRPMEEDRSFDDRLRYKQSLGENQSVDFDIEYSSRAISFDPGKSDLKAEQQESLIAFFDYAKSKGKIFHIKIAAWADVPYSAEKVGRFGKYETDLAEERGEVIKKVASDYLHPAYIKILNMAEDINWYDKLFDTDENKLKSLFISATIDDSSKISDELKIFFQHGQASTVVVVIATYAPGSGEGGEEVPLLNDQPPYGNYEGFKTPY